MFKFLTILAIVIAPFIAKTQKLSLLTAHVVLNGTYSGYESGDSTAYYYSGLRGHGGLHHSSVNYDSSTVYKIVSSPPQYVPTTRYQKTFDIFDNTIISTNFGLYATTQRDSSSYGPYNNIVFKRYSYKPYNASSFIDNEEVEYFYNPDSTLNYVIGSKLNMVTNQWEPSIDTYTYANKSLVYRLLKVWDNGNWKNFAQISRSYIGNNVKQLIVEQWASNAWVVGEKHIYNYDNSDRLVEDSAGSKIDSFFYDANNNLIVKAHWTITSGKYLLWKDSFEYDTLNRLVLRTNFITQANGQKIYGSGECGDKYYYNDTPAVVPVAISSTDADKKLVLYPNPATKDLHIKHSFPQNQAVQWSIVNAVGRVIRRWETTSDAPQVIALSDLVPGVYYLTFASGSDRGSGQFVLIE